MITASTIPTAPSNTSNEEPLAMPCATRTWKADWATAREHHCAWWRHEGFVVAGWGGCAWAGINHDPEASEPPMIDDARRRHEDPLWRSQFEHARLARLTYPLDTPTIASTNIGPGSLALGLGSEPGFGATTIWFHPCWKDLDDPTEAPPLRFDPQAHWFQIHEQTCQAMVERAAGRYLVGCPDLIENIDVLASLRDAETLLMDMIEEPEWVEEKVAEINTVWLAMFDRLHAIIADEHGGNAWAAFGLYGPGRTAKVQCDASAMFSPAMFERFVVPGLRAQCAAIDYSMFHLDGSDCIQHLDLLLEIDELDAIEWTPDPKAPKGGDPCWYPMYRKILEAGKSVQAIGLRTDEVIPLFDAIGTKGVYAMPNFNSPEQAAELERALQAYR